ncbi:hypothetical protein BDR26DRAFT_932450 [Obelidium mucronatum]|nr:hypothetical protein BDR26DRAFT_932450 [Obelidium mucronatum]
MAAPPQKVYVRAVVLKEDDEYDEANPGRDHNDHLIVHLSTGFSKTVDYDLYTTGSDIGTIRVLDGAKSIKAMVTAYEFETENGKGYEWSKFHDWILHKSGYEKTKWTNTHNSDTFNDLAVKHLLENTHRPEAFSELCANPHLDNLQAPTPEATKLFNSAKKEVILKFHELRKLDKVHNTHAFDEIEHLTAYNLKQFGTREVEYGTIYLGKIEIAEGKFLHVRVHKYHSGADKEFEFHSLRYTRDCGVWSDKAELVYFEYPSNSSKAASIAAKHLANSIKRGLVAHAHITPHFSQRIPLTWNQEDGVSKKVPIETMDAIKRAQTQEKHPTGNTFEIEADISSHSRNPERISSNSKPELDTKPIEPATMTSQKTTKSALDEIWIKDVLVSKTSPTLNDDQFPVRISIHPFMQNPSATYPQCHRLTIKSPLRDAFYHWSFLCNPFNFRTMVRNYGWKISQNGESEGVDSMLKAFEGFGSLVKDRVRECLRDPERFKIVLEEFEPDNLLVLNFVEIVSGYRRVTLMSLEFVPSPWKEVVSDVRMDYERTRAHYFNVHNALVQSLDVVSKYQPSILLTGGVPDPLQPQQLQSWKELVQDLLLPTADGRVLTSDEKMMRTKMFVLMTLPNDETLEPVLSKSMEIPIQGYHGDNNQVEKIRATLTFYAKRYKKEPPSSYTIVIRTSDDVFLNFTSEEITPLVFHSITSRIQIESKSPHEQHEKYHATQRRNTWRDEEAFEERRKGRSAVFGFHPGEGLGGGVVGVLVNDFLKGVEDDPGRYGVLLRVRNRGYLRDLESGARSGNNEGEKENMDVTGLVSGFEWLMVDPVAGGRGTRAIGVKPPDPKDIENVHKKLNARIYELHGLTSRNPPELRKAKLVFTETVMYRKKEILEIAFHETAREEMQKEVREQYGRLKTEIDWVQHRLDVLYDTVRRKNPSLMATLGTIPTPRSFFGRPTIASKIASDAKTEFRVPVLEPETRERTERSQSRIRGTNRPVIVVTNPIVSKEIIHDMGRPHKAESRKVNGRELELNPHIVMGKWSISHIPVLPIKEKTKPKRKITSKVYDVHGGAARVQSRSNSPSRASVMSPSRTGPSRTAVYHPQMDESTDAVFDEFIRSEINFTKRAVGKAELPRSRPQTSRSGSRIGGSVSRLSSRQSMASSHRFSETTAPTSPSIREWPQPESPLSRLSAQ